jgi:hydrogenase expression/formation protein HypE
MDKISLEHGSGGKLMRELISLNILKHLKNPILENLNDSAFLKNNIAFTTDSYVVDPIFFPGGDIGTLCVNGTVNDLIVSGARPKYISLSLIIEEGFEMENLEKILSSIRSASRKADVLVTTGDTKVVRRGQCDKIFINTSGIGDMESFPSISKISPGDKIIITGSLGEHSLAVMLARGDFGLESEVKSDCAPLNFLTSIWKKGALWMRDVTRGGLVSVLSELSDNIPFSLLIEEEKIPLSREVRGATELLGIDPLYLACEGRAVIVVPEKKATETLKEIKKTKQGKRAAIIGQIEKNLGKKGELLLSTQSGGMRLLEPLTSELLPRIC